MIGAALLAKKAVEKGLKSKPWVKTTLAPGSKVVTDYYDRADLTKYMEALGFNLVGYGCDSGLQHTIRELIKAQSQVLCGELCVNVELSAQGHWNASLVEIFNIQCWASSTNETARSTDVYSVTDFCAYDCELVVIVAVNFRCESQFILQDHQRFVGDLANGQ